MLKENGVVDAGGYGLAILVEGFRRALGGRGPIDRGRLLDRGTDHARVEPVDDWDDDEYLYCTEFLLFGEGIDRDVVDDYVATEGGSELVVGDGGALKIHVHTNDPGSVLAHMTAFGEVAEVHINNMRRQTEERDAALVSEHAAAAATPRPTQARRLRRRRRGPGLVEISTSSASIWWSAGVRR